MKHSKGNKKPFALAWLAERALKKAVVQVVEEHKRSGGTLAVWRNGRVVQLRLRAK